MYVYVCVCQGRPKGVCEEDVYVCVCQGRPKGVCDEDVYVCVCMCVLGSS